MRVQGIKFLITGRRGQLAEEFSTMFRVPISQVDITDRKALRAELEEVKPDVVLNCASYNNVDGAETDKATADKVNFFGTGYLASACEDIGAFLVQYSTDYVFSGNNRSVPYTEDDTPDPTGYYGMSKYKGEHIIPEMMPHDNYLILRLSWVYGRGEGKANSLHKLLKIAENNEVVRMADDQVSIPTSTWDVVFLTTLALNHDLTGIYHCTASGYASRYEMCKYLYEQMGIDKELIPVSMDYFKAAAQRPHFAPLSNGKLADALGIKIPDWKTSVELYARMRNVRSA